MKKKLNKIWFFTKDIVLLNLWIYRVIIINIIIFILIMV